MTHVIRIYGDVAAETDHAIQIAYAGKLVWLPKRNCEKQTDGTIQVPHRIAASAWKHPSAKRIK